MYIKAKSLEGIIENGLNGKFIAGGTDLVPLMKLGLKKPSALIDVTGIPELRKVSLTADEMSIGAAVTLSELASSLDAAKFFPALVQSAAKTASLQIRNVGTLGGNIMQDRRCIFFNQSASWRSSMPKCFKAGGSVCLQIKNSPVCRAIYYSDTATALLLYDAKAEIIQNGCQRTIPLAQLIEEHSAENGLYSDASGVLLVRVRIPLPPDGEKSGFLKYSLRSSIDFPLVNFAIRMSGGARPSMAVAGAAASVPLILEKSSLLLDGRDTDAFTEAAAAEIKEMGGLIRESTVPPKVKIMSYRMIGELYRTLVRL